MAPKAKRSPSKSASASASVAGSSHSLVWKFTKVMNMRDLSRDDDYLSHLFVEKLGVSTTPLMVHKMDPLRRLPKTDAAEILATVQRLIHARPTGPAVVKQAVSELLAIPAVLYFIRDYEQSQINAFATHASRYLELYLPNGSIEIAQTSRYSKWTGKSELCILATRALPPGHVISELKGSMADLTEEEDKELKRTGARDDGGVRRDFSVIHSKQMKKNHLFLGPARFVNHDCDHNCELFRTGRYITFRVLKPIAVGQEVTAHYGDGYFGRNNRHCLCETCERRGKGGYGPQTEENDTVSDSDSFSDSDSATSISSSDDEEEEVKVTINVNQRSTRRGVYLTLPAEEESGESEHEVVVERDKDTANTEMSDLTPAPSPAPVWPPVGVPCIDLTTVNSPRLSVNTTRLAYTPVKSGVEVPHSTPAQSLSAVSPSTSSATSPASRSSVRSLITTRSQRLKEAAQANANPQLITPPLSDVVDGASSISASQSRARSPPLLHMSTPRDSEPAPPCDAPSAVEAEPAPPPPRRGRGRPRKYPLPEPGAAPVPKAVPRTIPKEKEKPVPRVLRQRASLPVLPTKKVLGVGDVQPTVQSVGNVAKEKEKEKVPSCITCLTALPVEPASLSCSPVTRKGKAKEVKEECTRCKRHFVIYGVSWPQRNPIPGSGFLPTPREDTPSGIAQRITHKDLPILDRKLEAVFDSHKKQRGESVEKLSKMEQPVPARKRPTPKAVGCGSEAGRSSHKRRREEAEVVEEQPKKKRPVGRPSKLSKTLACVKEALKSRKRKREDSVERRPGRPKEASRRGGEAELPGRSKRASHPSLKVREREKSPVVKNADASSPPPVVPLMAQPRDNNGRFGKKDATDGRYRRNVNAGTARMKRVERSLKGRAAGKRAGVVEVETVVAIEAVVEVSEKKGDVMASPRRGARRGRKSGVDDDSPQAVNKGRVELVDDRRDKTFWPALPSMPPCGSGFKRTGLLNMRPNPALVSRWRSSPAHSSHSAESTPTLLDDNTEDDDGRSDEQPATPPEEREDSGDVGSVTPKGVRAVGEVQRRVPRLDVIDVGDSDEEGAGGACQAPRYRPPVLPPLRGLGLCARPNPITFSKRTWAPDALLADGDDEDDVIALEMQRRDGGGGYRTHASNGSTPTSQTQDSAIPNGHLSSRLPPLSPYVRGDRDRDSSLSNALLGVHVRSPPIRDGTSSPFSILASEVFAPCHHVGVLERAAAPFDAEATSSGEEDVILPDPPESCHFTLQRAVTFEHGERADSPSAKKSGSSPGEISKQSIQNLLNGPSDDVHGHHHHHYHQHHHRLQQRSPTGTRGSSSLSGVHTRGVSQTPKEVELLSDLPKDLFSPIQLQSSFLPPPSSMPVPSCLIEAGWDSASE